MKRATYKAFTLIEMLIVMGILVILMVVGVAAGRFAIDRANQIAHQNGATQLYQALQSHFTDYGRFPSYATLQSMTTNTNNVEGALGKYLDMGSFKGGSEADYSYYVNSTRQAVVVCVTLGGAGDETNKGVSCVGNGFALTAPDTLTNGSGSFTITKEFYEADDNDAEYNAILEAETSFWNGDSWGTVNDNVVQ